MCKSDYFLPELGNFVLFFRGPRASNILFLYLKVKSCHEYLRYLLIN